MGVARGARDKYEVCLRVRFIAIAMYSVYSIALMETITKITINTSSTWLMVIDWQM